MAGAASAPHHPSGRTAVQQLQQAVFSGAAANSAAGTALAMAAAGGVSAAAQRSFSFWPSLAGATVNGGAQQAHVTAQRLIQQQQAVTNAKELGDNSKNASATGTRKQSMGRTATSLSLTAASLGMSQDQLATIFGNNRLGANMATVNLNSKAGGHKSPPGSYSSAVAGKMGNPETQSVTFNGSSSSRDLVSTALRRTGDGKGPSDNSTSLSKEDRMAVALNMLRAESSSLIKRCMLMAGFEPCQTDECGVHHLEFVERAVKAERQRIASIRARTGSSRGCYLKNTSERDSFVVNDTTKSGRDKKTHFKGYPPEIKKEAVDGKIEKPMADEGHNDANGHSCSSETEYS